LFPRFSLTEEVVMAKNGPIPKRSESLQRRNAPSTVRTAAPGAEIVVIPEADPLWHPIASRLWESLALSGQSKFYEPSDWALAFSVMDDLSEYKQQSRRSAQMLASIYTQMGSLLITEGDRRRVGIELARKSSDELEDAGVMEMKKWRQQLSS
jgi:hypothetical protein